MDVYAISIKYVVLIFKLAEGLVGVKRHIRDQLLRASHSITLNIAEGNGRTSERDRSRFFDIARGSALECAAIHDILIACKMGNIAENNQGKFFLHRIVSMLSRMGRFTAKNQREAIECVEFDNDYDHRFADHDHERR